MLISNYQNDVTSETIYLLIDIRIYNKNWNNILFLDFTFLIDLNLNSSYSILRWKSSGLFFSLLVFLELMPSVLSILSVRNQLADTIELYFKCPVLNSLTLIVFASLIIYPSNRGNTPKSIPLRASSGGRKSVSMRAAIHESLQTPLAIIRRSRLHSTRKNLADRITLLLIKAVSALRFPERTR